MSEMDAAVDTSEQVPDSVTGAANGKINGSSNGHPKDTGSVNGSVNGKASGQAKAKPAQKGSASKHHEYLHVAAVHSRARTSCLSHDSVAAPSFLGFRNLLVLVVVVMNLRLVVENFLKYGILICICCHGYRREDLLWAVALYALVPCHLFIAYVIEAVAARHAQRVLGAAKKVDQPPKSPVPGSRALNPHWTLIRILHALNATLCLFITSHVVYNSINHPLIGTITELHAIIVWLKICSYAFTNRDLRHALLYPQSQSGLPELYRSCPYPRNVTLKNLSYFWWAPTLVYQPVYPRSDSIRWIFVAKRLAEVLGLSIFIWLTSAQYAAPVLRNSFQKMAAFDIPSITERLMKLSTVSLIIWLAGFFALFQSMLNALAEVMRFGDREFYTDWWNSPSVGTYWRTWNKPVYSFMRRHIYTPLLGRGWSSKTASAMVFVFSGILHEMLVGLPTHNILGVAFFGMVVQIPLIAGTLPLEKMEGPNGKMIGNCIFWISFCIVGQPLAALLYFFAWQAKYGNFSHVS